MTLKNYNDEWCSALAALVQDKPMSVTELASALQWSAKRVRNQLSQARAQTGCRVFFVERYRKYQRTGVWIPLYRQGPGIDAAHPSAKPEEVARLLGDKRAEIVSRQQKACAAFWATYKPATRQQTWFPQSTIGEAMP